MGSFSIWHWLVVLVVVLIFFGAGRLPTVMGDLAKGIKNFKAGMKEGEKPDPADEVVARAAEPPATARVLPASPVDERGPGAAGDARVDQARG